MNNIYVGNLDLEVTKESIRSLFEPHGTVAHIKVKMDRETGLSRGFAFVEMVDAEQAGKAIAALNGADLRGRALNVREARPKLNRSETPQDHSEPIL